MYNIVQEIEPNYTYATLYTKEGKRKRMRTGYYNGNVQAFVPMDDAQRALESGLYFSSPFNLAVQENLIKSEIESSVSKKVK